MTCLLDSSVAGSTAYPLAWDVVIGTSAQTARPTLSVTATTSTSATNATAADPSSSPTQKPESPRRAPSAEPMCRRCHQSPVRAKYAKLCEGCAAGVPERQKAKKARWHQAQDPRIQPCRMCGERRPKPYTGTRYCVDCNDTALEVAKVRIKANSLKKKKPCRGCGGVKRRKRGAYCDACYRKRHQLPTCRRCDLRPVRFKHAKLCETCALEAAQEQRRKKAERERGYKRPDRVVIPTSNAARRMTYRLKREAEGYAPKLAAPILADTYTRVDSEQFPRLPAMPLYRAITGLIEREARGSSFGGIFTTVFSETGQPLSPVSAPRGDGVLSLADAIGLRLAPDSGRGGLQRRMNAWLSEERRSLALVGPRLANGWFGSDGWDQPRVAFDLADRVLTNSGLCWWDVWDGDEVCSNGRTVEWVFTTTELVAA